MVAGIGLLGKAKPCFGEEGEPRQSSQGEQTVGACWGLPGVNFGLLDEVTASAWAGLGAQAGIVYRGVNH